jgi:uncharacterized protein with GYD domain
MPLYEMRWMFKDAALKSMTDEPQDREAPARELVEGYGGRMLHYYFMLGEYDGLAIGTCSSPMLVGARREASTKRLT